ncbi:11252_t:CDS:2 [Diversispora eburnea]|uniref:Dolichyl-diphosphooligosaccharide--protein glycosyltransferase subunit 1 n=1 Tax=Diversispora eburnea TaxID=1213867 RepID=A0A9N9AMZ9_9GLOM|nr:11252_t:CDS:2 [Diversispora eburnea]
MKSPSLSFIVLVLIVLNFCLIHNTSATTENEIIIPQYWINTKIIRTIDISTVVVRENIAIMAKNVHNEPLREYYFPINEKFDVHLSYITVKEKKTLKIYNVEKADFDSFKRIQFYKITFDQDIDPQGKIIFTVSTAFIHMLTPYPAEIPQSGRQNLLFRENLYGNSVYITEQQKTTINYTQKPGVSRDGKKIIYVFDKKKPDDYEELLVHYEFQQALLTIKGARRDFEISHWGNNLAVEEHYNLTHDGAKLKGQFSRLEYQQTVYTHHETTMARDFLLVLPGHASDVYYRDEIGNVSTSRLRKERERTILEFKPRYPLLGGWNYTWYYGYNVPLGEFLKYNHQTGRYIFKVPSFINPFHNAVFDKVQVRIILPEETHTVHKTFFDSKGRYLIVLDKYNVIQEHSSPFLVSYEYDTIELLRKPLVASTFFFCGFLLSMVYSRMEFRIGK